jgi:calcineurin-like phosphoesterase family protein
MNHFFSADLHLSHKNILGYCNRNIFMTKEDKEKYLITPKEQLKKFNWSDESINNMNDGLIRNINSRCKKGDILYHIGDWGFGNNDFESKLNCKVIQLQGNHDRHCNKTNFIIQNIKIKLGGYLINLTHKPEHANLDCPINLVGHEHNKFKLRKVNNSYLVNVGVDVWNYFPCDIQEILREISKFKNQYEKRN